MDVRQIWLVIKREYTTRIKSRAFILTTVLIPLGMAGIIAVAITITVWDTQTEHVVGIADRTGELYTRLARIDSNRYVDMSSLPESTLRAKVIRGEIEGYIVFTDSNIVSNANAELIYGGSGGIQLLSSLRNDVQEVIRQERLERADVPEEVRRIYESRPRLETSRLNKEGIQTEDNVGLLTGIGLFMGVIIFGIVLGYGGLLTRSVIEEKTNRIIEIVTSSVRPVDLLMGKIVGVGGLAVTQVGIWIAAALGLAAVAGPVAGTFMDTRVENLQVSQPPVSAPDPGMFELPPIEPMLIILFFLFLIFGYLIYSTMFAAIGSAADTETDTQQFMFPVMIPVLISYFLLFRVMEAPDSSLAVVSSLFPLFTPILMITRIAITEVPAWQVALSFALMSITFAGILWLSAKIYSVGILSYGNSASFRELMKWIRQK